MPDSPPESSLEADARRYRWLKTQFRPSDPQVTKPQYWILPVTVLLRDRALDLDTAVDAAENRWCQEQGMRIWSAEDPH